MKSFKNQARQGDVLFCRIDALPESAKLVPSSDGRHIVAHSETGHHHVIDDPRVQMYLEEGNPFVGYLTVEDIAFIEHLRDFDTHETLEITPGTYKIIRQRERAPEGYRRAAD